MRHFLENYRLDLIFVINYIFNKTIRFHITNAKLTLRKTKLQLLNSKNCELRLRISPEAKHTLKSIAKLRNTTLNNIGVLLINEILYKKPSLRDILFQSKAFKPGIEQNLLEKYKNLAIAYSKLKFFQQHNCVNLRDCDSFMTASTNFIETLEYWGF